MTRRRLALAAAALAAVALAAGLLRERRRAGDPLAGLSPDARIEATCSSCHAFPPPEILPRAAWRTQIEHMRGIGAQLPDAPDALPFAVDEVVAWYESRAPESLPVEPTLTRDGPPPLRFERRGVLLGPGSGPGVATVSRLGAGLLPGRSAVLAAPNMATGGVYLFTLEGGPVRVGDATHPARVSAGDLDLDGAPDLLIADLGDTLPSDEPKGRVVVGRNRGDGSFRFETVLDDVGRVADVTALDLDADGDLDLGVACFAWLRRGGIYVLHNETPAGVGAASAPLRFRSERIDPRAGAVSIVPVHDLWPGAGAGFAVAFAQHYEQVSAFHPTPDGWRERVLYRAPHPNWGTSNLAPVDLDRDGDLDFLLSHGDTLDDGIAFKPWHGVEWLENGGDGSFELHPIGRLYGAHASAASDLDGDGDLDVLAAGFLPQVQLPVPRDAGMRVDSLVWFERTPDEWIPWAIEIDHPRHTGLAALDLDGDGRPDVATAINTAWDLKSVEKGPGLEIWLNRGSRATPPR